MGNDADALKEIEKIIEANVYWEVHEPRGEFLKIHQKSLARELYEVIGKNRYKKGIRKV